jgi:hypothetical protein
MRVILRSCSWFCLGAFAFGQLVSPNAAFGQLVSPNAPERRNASTNVTGYMTDFEYVDADMLHGGTGPRESDPIDDANESLKRDGFSCLRSVHVSWNGAKGSAQDHVSVHSRFAIECTGDCRGVRYLPRVPATIFLFGTSRPVPIVDIKATWFGGSNFVWQFTRPSGAEPEPDVYIHQWTSGKMEGGPGCRAPKATAVDAPRLEAPQAVPRSPEQTDPYAPSKPVPAAGTRAYTGPPGGSLAYHRPVPPFGEVAFDGLPLVPLKITCNDRFWSYRLEPDGRGTQRLVLKSKLATVQTNAIAFWAVTR